jgi:hypothetical protein
VQIIFVGQRVLLRHGQLDHVKTMEQHGVDNKKTMEQQPGLDGSWVATATTRERNDQDTVTINALVLLSSHSFLLEATVDLHVNME